MSIAPALQLPDPPDLLRRFVPTPHEGCIRRDGMHIHLRTNESRLVETFGRMESCSVDDVNWTMVCDPELPSRLSEPVTIESESVLFLGFGRACFMAIDRVQKEITGFMSARLSDEEWSAVIFPAVLRVMSNDGGSI
jgi:hypothetical protein